MLQCIVCVTITLKCISMIHNEQRLRDRFVAGVYVSPFARQRTALADV